MVREAVKNPTTTAADIKEKLNIGKLEFLPQPPDLNPIQHLWTILNASVSRDRTILKNFFSELETDSKNLNSLKLKNLLESMPKRLHVVINNEGVSLIIRFALKFFYLFIKLNRSVNFEVLKINTLLILIKFM